MTDCPLCRIPRFLLKPREAFQEAKNEPLSVAAFTLIPLVVLFSVLFTGISVLLSPGFLFGPLAPLVTGSGLLASGATLAALLVGILVLVILCLIAMVVKAAWLHLFVYALGGRQGLDQTVKAVFYAAIPILLLGWIPLVGLIAGALWGIVILIFGIEVLHGVSSGRALAAAFLAWMVGFLLFLVLPLLFFLPVRVVTSGPLP
ncbi:MAG: YIP1 family protein [Methanomicrobiales archaeon]|nr:YIP1 family protein [Methanomicrobiales archaeon]